ncbi:hypothetical protein [Tepidibacter aestuarii]|nr:hypothetical protein [Tepidibacter aestuarii]CAH2212783.1 protein of unknown function [Tepidibacter aestuarii]
MRPQESYEKYRNKKSVGIVRASLGMYNNIGKINRFVDALRKL